MDDNKPPIPPSKNQLWSASERTSTGIDPSLAGLAALDERVAVERQSRSGPIEPCRNDFPDRPSVAVYYRNEEEVGEGFLLALRAIGVGVAKRPSEPAKRGRF